MNFIHGIAIAKVDVDKLFIRKDKTYIMTAYLPDEDIVCIGVEGILVRMDVVTFNKWFEKKD